MLSHTIMGAPNTDMNQAAISAIRLSIEEFGTGAQAVHIILASLILSGTTWKALASVVREPDRDDIFSEPIIFCHLPNKYNQIYDALLPEVDHLNLIADDSIWKNIKTYLLDVYFYQAVHFKAIERMADESDTSSAISPGYFKEIDRTDDLDLAPELLFDITQDRRQDFKSEQSKLFDNSFYAATENQELKLYRDKEERVRWRENGNKRHQSDAFIKMLKYEA